MPEGLQGRKGRPSVHGGFRCYSLLALMAIYVQMHQDEPKLKTRFLSHTSHISGAQWPHTASGCSVGRGGSRTRPLLQSFWTALSLRSPSRRFLPSPSPPGESALPVPSSQSLRACESGSTAFCTSPLCANGVKDVPHPVPGESTPVPSSHPSHPRFIRPNTSSLLSGPIDTPVARMQNLLTRRGEKKKCLSLFPIHSHSDEPIAKQDSSCFTSAVFPLAHTFDRLLLFFSTRGVGGLDDCS